MDQEKRMIIVKEIEHWQRNKLLPDHYCDFLLNLYRDPESGDGSGSRQERKRAIVESRPLYWVLLIGIIGLICYAGLHFSLFPPLLQIALFLAAVAALHGASAYCRNRKPLLSYLLFGVGAAVLLFGGAFLPSSAGAEEGWATGALYVACCSAIWVAFGVVLRVPWIHFCGWAGLILAYSVAVNRLFAPSGWAALELSWVPLAAVFGWIGWFFSRRSKQAGAVFLITACLLWFMPEGYAMAFTNLPPSLIQGVMIGKLIGLGAAAFALRKTWTEWVV